VRCGVDSSGGVGGVADLEIEDGRRRGGNGFLPALGSRGAIQIVDMSLSINSSLPYSSFRIQFDLTLFELDSRKINPYICEFLLDVTLSAWI
jgi:hypothetical protein